MSNVFSQNAFNVLGLDTNVSLRDINRKANEIIKNKEIGEDVVGGDFGLLKVDRSAAAIDVALNSLSTTKSKIQECFFWFEDNDAADKKAIRLIRDGKVEDAISFWIDKSDGTGIDSLLKKKNLAVLLTINTLSDGKEYLQESLTLWKEVLDSEKYWKSFEKIYEVNNDEAIDPILLEEFKEMAPKLLADAYLDASSSDKEIFVEFRKYFSVKGKEVEEKISNPALNQVGLAIESLEKLRVSEDGVFSEDEAKKIASAIKKIQEQLNKLVDFGLYEDSEMKVVRDKAATAIRGIVLDIHNGLGETEKGISLIKIALDIVGTRAMRDKLEEDINTLKDVLKQKEMLQPIDDLVGSGDYSAAISLIEEKQIEYKKNKIISEILKDKLKAIVAMYFGKLNKEGWDAFNSKIWSLAEQRFEAIIKLSYRFLEIYDFNKEGLDDYLLTIENKGALLKIDPALIDNVFKEIRESANKTFPDRWEGLVMVSLADARLMPKCIKYLRRTNTANTLITIGNFTFFIYGIGIIFWIIGWIYRRTGS